jgi:leucine dehydrogenase
LSGPAATLEAQLAAWDGLGVVCRYDAQTGAWLFVALHDETLGRPTGGTRLRHYASPTEGLRDAQRLAAGMTAKFALTGLPLGGGKAVIAVDRPLEGAAREGLLLRYGRLIDALEGGFATGPDMGIAHADLAVIARATRWVHDTRQEVAHRPSGEYTARGAYAALRAVLAHAFGSADPRGRRVLVEGVGAVGAPLARFLAEAGARLVLSDLDEARAARLAAELGAEVVAPEAVVGTPCDLYAPCAVGEVIRAATVDRLACRAIVGAANNQLSTDAEAAALHARGILFLPDYAASGGGALGVSLAEGGASEAEIEQRLEGLGTTAAEILGEAAANAEPPLFAAQRRVAAVLAAARG